MPDPSFNGTNIFGLVVVMTHDDPENAAQVNHYPGTQGIERLDLGVKEHYTIARGVLADASMEDLGADFASIRALKQGGTIANLVDTDGVTWNNVVLQTVHTKGIASYSPGNGWCREYEMRFLHLTPA